MRMTIPATLLLTSAVLCACKADITMDIYTSDLISTAADGSPKAAPAILSLDGQSKSTCAEIGPTLTDALTVGFPGATFKGCRDEGFNTWADYSVGIPISQAAATTTALAITATNDTGPIVAMLTGNREVMNQIIKALPEKAATAFNNDIDATINFTLRHDGEGEMAATVQGVFLDGEPIQTARTVTMAKRDSMAVKLSNVGDAALLRGGSLLVVLQP